MSIHVPCSSFCPSFVSSTVVACPFSSSIQTRPSRKFPKATAWLACPIMFSILRCSGKDGLYSTAIEVHVLVESALRKWLTAMHARFISEALEMLKTIEAESAVFFMSVRSMHADHLSSSTTKLCSDARSRTASHAKSRNTLSSFSRDMIIYDVALIRTTPLLLLELLDPLQAFVGLPQHRR